MDKLEFHALYQRHARDVHRFAYYLCGGEAQAEDITSETFLRAWMALDVIRTETVRAYLYSIARNLARERLRGRSRSDEGLAEMADPRPGPAEQAGDRLELRAALAALQRLNEADRAALVMRVQDGLSHEEIARVLGLSVTAVKVRIHRARLALATLKIRQERSP